MIVKAAGTPAHRHASPPGHYAVLADRYVIPVNFEEPDMARPMAATTVPATKSVLAMCLRIAILSD